MCYINLKNNSTKLLCRNTLDGHKLIHCSKESDLHRESIKENDTTDTD